MVYNANSDDGRNKETRKDLTKDNGKKYLHQMFELVGRVALVCCDIGNVIRSVVRAIDNKEELSEELILQFNRCLDEWSKGMGIVTLELGYCEGVLYALSNMMRRQNPPQNSTPGASDELKA